VKLASSPLFTCARSSVFNSIHALTGGSKRGAVSIANQPPCQPQVMRLMAAAGVASRIMGFGPALTTRKVWQDCFIG